MAVSYEEQSKIRKNYRGGGDGPRLGLSSHGYLRRSVGGLVENRAQSVLGRRTPKSRVAEAEMLDDSQSATWP